jgi:uncharacterized protein YbaR (Trm112 family)
VMAAPVRTPEIVVCPQCNTKLRIWMILRQRMLPHISQVDQVSEC